jgi:branched-chain amino acid transport system ATP-binding protein
MEVIYNHIILVLKGVSLTVPERGIVALLGGNGAGKTTTLRAISNLLKGGRGAVTKGYIDYREGLAEFDRPVELTAAWGKKRCGHRLKGWKIRVSNHELDARP